MNKKVAEAVKLAHKAHHGQTDKQGVDYFQHPMWVMKHVEEQGYGDVHQMVAVLHDVVEDTDVTMNDVWKQFGSEVASGVFAMTHQEGENNDDYYARVKKNPVALVVKKADVDHNLGRVEDVADPEMRARLKAKYEHALEVLNA